MRRTKSNQIKIRSLQNVKWKAKAEIMQKRKAGEATTCASSTKDLKGLQTDAIQNVLKDEITEYVKSIVTKSNTTTIQQKPQSKATRKLLLDEIKRERAAGDGLDDEQVHIQDIAAHIHKDLRKGWQNGQLPPIN